MSTVDPIASGVRAAPEARSAYRAFRPITSRWMDNDVYGHINNVVYYSFFAGMVIGLVIETRCNYFAPLAFPQPIEAGLRVAHVGRSSVRYEVGLFAAGEPLSAAAGHFVHVYVDRETRRPAHLPQVLVQALDRLRAEP